MPASSGVNTRRRYFCVVMSNEIELVILAGVVVSLVALGAAVLRNKKPDPKMAFLLALLQDLPADSEETRESDESGDARDAAEPEPTPGSRISDFFA
jgi:hypothetical protein